MAAYAQALRNYAVFRGRAGRSEFWWFVLVQGLIYIVAGLFEHSVPDWVAIVLGIYYLLTLLPWLALCVRRLHDTGKSAWWLPAGVVPVPVAVALLVAGVNIVGIAFVFGFIFLFVDAFTGTSLNEFGGFLLAGIVLLVLGGILIISGVVLTVTLVVFLASRGEPGDNRYGRQPT